MQITQLGNGGGVGEDCWKLKINRKRSRFPLGKEEEDIATIRWELRKANEVRPDTPPLGTIQAYPLVYLVTGAPTATAQGTAFGSTTGKSRRDRGTLLQPVLSETDHPLLQLNLNRRLYIYCKLTFTDASILAFNFVET